MSVDVGEWLKPYLASRSGAPLAETPSAFDHARFLDSQPSTPLSMCVPATTTAQRNAFGMETLVEASPGLGTQIAKVGLGTGLETHMTAEGCYMPSFDALTGGA